MVRPLAAALGAALVLAALGPAAPAQAQETVPCAGLALARVRAAAAPITDANGAILHTLPRLDRTILAVRRCEGGRYVVMWGPQGAGEAYVERTLMEARPRGVRAGDRAVVGAQAVHRITAPQANALMAAWRPEAGAAGKATCESAAGARRSAQEGLFGAMGLSSACPPAPGAPAAPPRP